MINFVAEGRALLPELVRLRRALHADPEIGLTLPRTQQRVLTALHGLDLEISTGTRTTSVVAVLRGARPGPTVLLRGDMDALPVAERSGVDFAATNGNMHACGHDLHVAGLVGTARLLAAHREALAGSVIFMFQPGEEGYGGAKVMLEEGLLTAAGPQPPVAAYAIHVSTGPKGVFATRSGPFNASANRLHITVHGRGGHGSRPYQSIDPVPAVAEIVTALHTMVTRSFNVFDPVVLTVTQLSAGEAINVIPSSASLGATIRTLSQESTDRIGRMSRQLADGIAAAHGCTAEVDFTTTYPVTATDPDCTEAAMATLGAVFGRDRTAVNPHPSMGSEDFSFVLEQVPGAFFQLGAAPSDYLLERDGNNHSPTIRFDDAVLGDQAAALAHLACQHLDVRS